MNGFFAPISKFISYLGFEVKKKQNETIKDIFESDSDEAANDNYCDSALHNSQIIDSAVLNTSDLQQCFYQLLIPAYYRGELLSNTQKEVIRSVHRSLQNKDYRIKAVPRLPSVIPKLLQSLRNPNSSTNDYVEIIKKDPMMSTGILKMANSAYYNQSGTSITSFERAVVVLGMDGVRAVLSTIVMQPVIQRKSTHYTQLFGQVLWQHSLWCAVTCETLAKQRSLEPYLAYLMGLSHDIGKITIFNDYCQQLEENGGKEKPAHSGLELLMSKYSAHLSYLIAEDWQLPGEITIALKQIANFQSEVKMDDYGYLLFQSNMICEAYLIFKQDESDGELIEHLIEVWELPKSLLNRLDQLEVDV